MENPFDTRSVEELAAVSQAGERVKELMEHPGWGDLLAGLAAEGDTKIAKVGSSSPLPEIKDYAHAGGVIFGLNRVPEIAGEIIEEGETALLQLEALEAQA